MNIEAATFPIRVAYTHSGQWGYVIYAHNDLSGWKPVGKIYTGDFAWRDVHIARAQLVDELEQEAQESI